MRLQLISDLHTEFHEDPLAFVSSLEIEPGLDFLVLAGDIGVMARQDTRVLAAVFAYLCTRAKHVVYVIGNHEYYGSAKGAGAEFKLRSILPKNCTWLYNDEALIGGVHFYGGAMWFPADPLNQLYERYLSDFSQIGDFRQWVYEDNRMFTELAMEEVKSDTIVVSHHLPHMNSVPALYKDSQLNRFFVSDQTKVIAEKQPRLWLHGHTHLPCDYKLGETRVMCNPYGYPHERNDRPYPPVVLDI